VRLGEGEVLGPEDGSLTELVIGIYELVSEPIAE
jgi:hypothetical protein